MSDVPDLYRNREDWEELSQLPIDEFIQVIGHDILMYLGKVRGFVELLQMFPDACSVQLKAQSAEPVTTGYFYNAIVENADKGIASVHTLYAYLRGWQERQRITKDEDH